MEDSEKLTALKKAYADIILNTAKEAAAKIMLSERRTIMFQRELVSTKQDALRMLLRLKNMLDFKVGEAEMISLSQQKKTDELEAQLQEAEEIVRDLREELRGVQAELEKVTINKMHCPVVKNMVGENAPQAMNLQNRFDPYRSIYSAPDSWFESFPNFDTRNSTVNGIKENSMCCPSHDHIHNCYIHNPDFASIVIKRKEPELYRNGCTHRIRAFERRLFDENISLPENVDVQSETIVRGDEEGKVMTVTTKAKISNISEAGKPDELNMVNEEDDHVKVLSCTNKETRLRGDALQSRLCSHQVVETNKLRDTALATEQSVSRSETVKDEALVEVPLCRKKRRINKEKALQAKLHVDQGMETNKASYISCTKNSPGGFDSNNRSTENSSLACEDEAQKNLMSASPKEPIDTIAMTKQSGSQNETVREEVFLEACSAWNKIKDDRVLLDKSELMGLASLCVESLEVPTCTADYEGANEPSDKLGLKVSDSDKVSCQSVNDRFIKYTFQRKRKKEPLSSPIVDCSLENNTLKEKCGEKQNGHVEPQKSCTLSESSWDGPRLAQVAHQVAPIK